MDDALTTWRRALEIYGRDPIAWSALWGVFVVAAVLTLGLGSILLPNALRATRDALREERAPALDALFQLDADRLMQDAIAAGGATVASMVAGSIVGPLGSIVSMALAPAPALVTEPEVGGIDALQLTVGYLQRNPVPILVHGLIGVLVNLPAACCLVPLFVTAPISGIAHWLFYEQHRDGLMRVDKA